MNLALALEDISLGEANLDDASRTVEALLGAVDDRKAHELFDALRSWVWKALDTRRRDEDLLAWVEMFGKTASFLEDEWPYLGLKLEAYADLIQMSVMRAGARRGRDLLRMKHVRDVLEAIQKTHGVRQRKTLRTALGVSDPNLVRIVSPMIDEGYITREENGREVSYRLTEKGSKACRRDRVSKRAAYRLVVGRRVRMFVMGEKPKEQSVIVAAQNTGIVPKRNPPSRIVKVDDDDAFPAEMIKIVTPTEREYA